MPTLAGWTLEEELARGGAGTVFRARGPDGRLAALKLIQHGRGLSEVERRRFAREAEALLRLEHEHLVRARGVLEEHGRMALVMDLIEGESLEARVARAGPLDPRQAAWLALGVARGLAHAHGRGVVHRDVKPQNVLLRSDDRPVLVDFGLARDVALDRSHLTRTGTFMGTPGFWPPEQARGELDRIGPASDVYSLGATLYWALSGRAPFAAASLGEALDQVAHAAPPPLASLRPGLDPGLAVIAHRCLQKAPEDRYPTADALAGALEGWLSRAPAPARQGPSQGALLAAGLLVLGTGIAGGVLLARRRAPLPARAPVPVTEPRTAPAPPSTAPTPPATDPAPEPAPTTSAAVPEPAPPNLLADGARALQALSAGRHDEAIRLLEPLLELHPGNAAFLRPWVAARLRRGDDLAALLPQVERALAAYPGCSIARLVRAQLHYVASRFAAAVADTEAALADPALPEDECVEALYLRGACRVRLNDLQGGGEDLRKAVQLGPGYAVARLEWGALRARTGDKAGALEELSAALALGVRARERPRALAIRGTALLELERRVEARVDLEAALPLLDADDPLRPVTEELLRELPPRPAPALVPEAAVARRRALELVRSGDRAGALQVLDAAPAQGVDARTATLRGALLRDSGDRAGALESFERGIQADPTYGEAWTQRGLLHVEAGHCPEAIQDLWRGLSLQPGDAPAWSGLAEALMKQGRLLESRVALDRALALEDLGVTRFQRGVLRRTLGDLQGAVDDLSRAIDKGHRTGPCLRNRGLALAGLGRRAEAIRDLEAALPLLTGDAVGRREGEEALASLRAGR